MNAEYEVSTAVECAASLRSVLARLDRIVQDEQGEWAQSLSLAALHVQQAIALIHPRHALDS
jgi:hypothetical protein